MLTSRDCLEYLTHVDVPVLCPRWRNARSDGVGFIFQCLRMTRLIFR